MIHTLSEDSDGENQYDDIRYMASCALTMIKTTYLYSITSKVILFQAERREAKKRLQDEHIGRKALGSILLYTYIYTLDS